MDIRVRGLMVAAGALQDSFKKGNTLPMGINGSYLNDITSYSSQLKGDFTSLSEEFKAGRMTLEQYVSRLNVFVSMLNAGVTDTEAIGAEEIKKEYLRVKQMLDGQQTLPQEIQGITKAKEDNPILNNQNLIKSRIYASYKTGEDRLEKTEVIDPIIKGTKLVPINQSKIITKSDLDKAFQWLDEFTSKNK